MLKKTLVTALGLTALMAAEAFAQVPATLVLRSGERINGQLVDMGANFTMMVNGKERTIRPAEVSVIDFVGGGHGIPDTEVAGIRPNDHLLILKGGQSLHGNLYDITGRTPLILIFRTGGEERRINSSEVGRIFLAPPPSGIVATTGSVPPPAAPAPPANMVTLATVVIPANQQWTNTGVNVRQGEEIYLNGSGTIQLSDNAADTASPTGSASQRTAANAPLPAVTAGAIIGRVGTSAPFVLGPRVLMPASGELQFGINDDHVNDNAGQFTVVISRPSTGSASVGTSGTTPAPAPAADPGPVTTGSAPAGTLVIPANAAWTPTGAFVRGGETVNFSSSGTIQLSTDGADKAYAQGSVSGRTAANAPVANAAAGALIGRIGNGTAFAIGNSAAVTMPASGPLYLGINDDFVGDNTGELYVRISK